MSLLQAVASTSRPPGSLSTKNVQISKAFPSVLLVPLATCAILVAPNPAGAGILSGSTGWSSIPFPSIPSAEEIQKIHEREAKRYEDLDAKFKSSDLVQDVLKRSKDNAGKNKKLRQNKLCERQVEWGIGDCALAFSTPEEKEKFLELLRKERAAAAQ